MTRLRQKMIEELERRNYSANTARGHLRAIDRAPRDRVLGLHSDVPALIERSGHDTRRLPTVRLLSFRISAPALTNNAASSPTSTTSRPRWTASGYSRRSPPRNWTSSCRPSCPRRLPGSCDRRLTPNGWKRPGTQAPNRRPGTLDPPRGHRFPKTLFPALSTTCRSAHPGIIHCAC